MVAWTCSAGWAQYLDSNANGLPDSWEEAWFPGEAVTGEGDNDHDGSTNELEFLAGTDPTDAASRFEPVGTWSEDDFSISFPTLAGRRYEIWGSRDLDQWKLAYSLDGSGITQTVHCEQNAEVSCGYFRVAIFSEVDPDAAAFISANGVDFRHEGQFSDLAKALKAMGRWNEFAVFPVRAHMGPLKQIGGLDLGGFELRGFGNVPITQKGWVATGASSFSQHPDYLALTDSAGTSQTEAQVGPIHSMMLVSNSDDRDWSDAGSSGCSVINYNTSGQSPLEFVYKSGNGIGSMPRCSPVGESLSAIANWWQLPVGATSYGGHLGYRYSVNHTVHPNGGVSQIPAGFDLRFPTLITRQSIGAAGTEISIFGNDCVSISRSSASPMITTPLRYIVPFHGAEYEGVVHAMAFHRGPQLAEHEARQMQDILSILTRDLTGAQEFWMIAGQSNARQWTARELAKVLRDGEAMGERHAEIVHSFHGGTPISSWIDFDGTDYSRGRWYHYDFACHDPGNGFGGAPGAGLDHGWFEMHRNPYRRAVPVLYWMHGESAGSSPDPNDCLQYGDYLRALLTFVGEDFPDCRFILGLPWKNNQTETIEAQFETVRAAIVEVAAEFGGVTLETSDLERDPADNVHILASEFPVLAERIKAAYEAAWE